MQERNTIMGMQMSVNINVTDRVNWLQRRTYTYYTVTNYNTQCTLACYNEHYNQQKETEISEI